MNAIIIIIIIAGTLSNQQTNKPLVKKFSLYVVTRMISLNCLKPHTVIPISWEVCKKMNWIGFAFCWPCDPQPLKVRSVQKSAEKCARKWTEQVLLSADLVTLSHWKWYEMGEVHGACMAGVKGFGLTMCENSSTFKSLPQEKAGQDWYHRPVSYYFHKESAESTQYINKDYRLGLKFT